MSCHERIDRAFSEAVRLPLCSCSRYVIFSDCHRGTGGLNDNFLKNRHLYVAALNHYLARGFYYLELGDGEDLWENRCINHIRESYAEVYGLHDCFRRQGRFMKIYGNHDMELRRTLPEAVILENREGGRDICMLHGHQADYFNYVCWRLTRFLVRYLWKSMEKTGFRDPTSAARSYRKLEQYERCLDTWAERQDVYLVAGHSHRPRLSMEGSLYQNAGSCVHPGGITCIEIENMEMTLVKWMIKTRRDMSLYAAREVLSGPLEISAAR